MPVYNVEKYLRQALNSVLEQTLKEIEVICVDDGSSDESLNILREYEEKDRRVKVITQNNMHAGVARNNGMKVARGEYYAFLDSDDFFESEMLEKKYNKCKKYNADICICGYDRYDVRTREFIRQQIPSKTDKDCFNADSVSHIFGVTNPAPWNKLFSARFVKESGIEFQSLARANDVFLPFLRWFWREKLSLLERFMLTIVQGWGLTCKQITMHRQMILSKRFLHSESYS